MAAIGYLRVSTEDQCIDRQVDALRGQCDEWHIERTSAAARKRPVFETVLENLSDGDCLVVLDLDRAFRSTIDAIQTVEDLQTRGVALKIINLNVDTTTPGGMLVYTVLSACAEFERRIISQRTKEGMAAAKKRGKKLGRPSKLSEEQLKRAAFTIQCGEKSVGVMAQEYGMSPWGLVRAIKRTVSEC